MSDKAAPEVAEAPVPSAPESAPEAEAPDTSATPETPETPESDRTPKPKSRAEARRQAIRRAKDMAPEVAERSRQKAMEQPREDAGKPEGGQFKKDQEKQAESSEEPDAQPEVAAESATEPKASADTAADAGSKKDETPAAPEVADDGLVEIPIPDGHPLRDQGKTSLRVPADTERDIRTTLNAAVRSRELDAVQQEKALLEARLTALQGSAPDPTTDPTIQELLRQIEDAEGFGPELRAKVEAAFQAQRQLKVHESERGAMQKVWEQRLVSDWGAEVDTEAPQMLDVWAESGELGMRLQNLKLEYLRKLDAYNQGRTEGTPPAQPTKDHFFKWVGQAYKADPRVTAKIEAMRKAEREAEREKLRSEVRAEEKRREEEKRKEAEARHDTRPPVSSSVTTNAPTPAEEGMPEGVRSPNRRKTLRQRARERAEQYAR